jgi:hypothetical protein
MPTPNGEKEGIQARESQECPDLGLIPSVVCWSHQWSHTCLEFAYYSLVLLSSVWQYTQFFAVHSSIVQTGCNHISSVSNVTCDGGWFHHLWPERTLMCGKKTYWPAASVWWPHGQRVLWALFYGEVGSKQLYWYVTRLPFNSNYGQSQRLFPRFRSKLTWALTSREFSMCAMTLRWPLPILKTGYF